MTEFLVGSMAGFFQFPSNFQRFRVLSCACAFFAALLIITQFARATDSAVVAQGATIEKLGEGYSFTDGPAADKDGNVYFTDNPNNRIVKWSAADGTFADWLKPAGAAVGTYFDKDGNLIVAATEKGELWSIAPDKTPTVLVTNFEGKVLNGPNDIWIRPDGGIYFTDPELYASRDPSTRVDIQGVYFLTPDHKTVKRVANDFLKPGGIIGTPDGKVLYVADFIDDKTYAYDVELGGELSNKRLFCDLNARGMTIDANGNLYLARFGVTIFDKTGKQMEHIDTPEKATNLTFGGKGNDLLFIAAAGSIYGLKMRVKGGN